MSVRVAQAPAWNAELSRLRDDLTRWLTQSAYPCWAHYGVDPRNGGFVEALSQNGRSLEMPRRARIHPRQIHAFAQARRFGWRGDASEIVRRGIEYFTSRYRRADGLFRTLVDAHGIPLDERALLYDQAFALLGYAGAAATLTAPAIFERRALELRSLIDHGFGTNGGGFRSEEGAGERRESNSHMHLLEACLTWAGAGTDGGWSVWARALIDLALSRFIDRDTGAVREFLSALWEPAPGVEGRIIEPGHQFEWASLMLSSPWARAENVQRAALRLIAVGERGVRNGVAVNSLLDDFTVHDPDARLWPQTERLKAAVLAAHLTGEERYGSIACSAASSLLAYLATPVAGLWFDVKLPNGVVVDSPAPASTLYHLVDAIAALDDIVNSAVRRSGGP
jgi:mannose/cellobiose epimerase-like protein (N-acyl-D-glucosamine 2-epimerase family)